MDKLKEKVRDYRISRNLSIEEFADLVNVHKTTISRWINDDLKDLSIYSCSKIVAVVAPWNKAVQEEYLQMHLSNMKQRFYVNMKVAFVLGHLNGYENSLAYILKECEHNDSLKFRRWGKVFTLYNSRIKGQDTRDVYLKIQKCRIEENEDYCDLNIFCDILSLLCLCDLGDFELMESYKTRISENLLKVTNNDLKSLLSYWVLEIWSYSMLRSNKIYEFEEIQKELRKRKDLKLFPVMKAFLDIRAGERFLFSDYKKSYEFLSKGLQVLKLFKDQLKYPIGLNNMNYLKILHWQDIDSIDLSTLHLAEQAFLLIRKNKKEEAAKLLNQLLRKNGKWTALQTCYMGMATDDVNLILKSINMFKAKSDFFFVEFAEKVYNEFIQNKNLIWVRK